MAIDVAGPAFPFRIDPETGGVAMASGAEKIRENVRLILGTRIGERPMLRDMGTQIASLVHDPNDDVLADLVQNQARNALTQWEPRILVTSMSVEQDGATLTLRIDYIHMSEPVAASMTVPLS